MYFWRYNNAFRGSLFRMNDEQTIIQNNDNAETGGKILIEILYALRLHLLFIIIVTVLFTAGGFVYAKIRKPIYTATISAQFAVEIESAGVVDQYSSTNYVFSYFNTAVDLCNKGGVVADRANVYYNYYLNEHRDNDISINGFITKLIGLYETVKKDRLEIPDYEVTEELMNEYRGRWFSSANVSASYGSSSSANSTTLFKIRVKSLDATYAKEMALIYALSADVSLNNYLDFGSVNDNATAGIRMMATRVSEVPVTPDVSKTKVVIISFLLGLVISAVAAYVMHLADTTVTTKEQLEQITGVNLIAYIDELAEVR